MRRALRIDPALVREWERRLNACGLENDRQGLTSEEQHVILPEGTQPPLRLCAADVQVSTRYGLRWQSSGAIPICAHWRRIPNWADDNRKIELFVRHRFPSAFRPLPNPEKSLRRFLVGVAARTHAKETASILYLAFRALQSSEFIAEQLHISQKRVNHVVADARDHGDKFFAGEKCCRNLRAASSAIPRGSAARSLKGA